MNEMSSCRQAPASSIRDCKGRLMRSNLLISPPVPAEAPAAAALPHSATQTEGRRQSGSQASASGREEKTEGVELIYGPMFAGKTTFLVAQLRAWRVGLLARCSFAVCCCS